MANDALIHDKNHPSNAFYNALEEILREGAKKFLQQPQFFHIENQNYISLEKRSLDLSHTLIQKQFLLFRQRLLNFG